MKTITFDGEAWEWFQGFVIEMADLVVRIKPVGRDQEFDAKIISADFEKDEVLVRFYDEARGAIGDAFHVRPECIHIY